MTDDYSVRFYESSETPILIRIGDINLDSFPDIITVFKNTKNNQRFFRIIINSPIFVDRAALAVKNSKFDFSLKHKYINYTDIEYVSFFDLDENGQLDILAVRKLQEANNPHDTYNTYSYRTIGLLNLEAYDSFFLKCLTTKSKNNFFSAEIGANYRYFVTDLQGQRKLRVATQHSQTSALNLELPYSFMGIGSSYNYIENFHVSTVSSSNNTSVYLKVFTPIIPNSQLLIYNYNDLKGDYWELDLIVTPISKIILVVIVILVILAALLFVIIILHFMEKVNLFIFSLANIYIYKLLIF